MELCSTVTGHCGLESEFNYISNYTGNLMDLIFLSTWNSNVRDWFEEYSKNGLHPFLKEIFGIICERSDEIIGKQYQYVKNWFTKYIKNTRIFISFVANLSVSTKQSEHKKRSNELERTESNFQEVVLKEEEQIMMVDNHQNHTVDEESIKRLEHTSEDDHKMSGKTVNKEEEEQALLVAEIYGKDHVDEETIAFESDMPETKRINGRRSGNVDPT